MGDVSEADNRGQIADEGEKVKIREISLQIFSYKVAWVDFCSLLTLGPDLQRIQSAYM